MVAPPVGSILDAILALYGILLALNLPAPFPKIYDCRNITYCPKYSKSCIKHYQEVGGTNNYERLVQKYPCCLCSSLNNKTCVCGAGGLVVRDLTAKIPANDPVVQIGTYLIITEYVDFEPIVEDCVMDSDCRDAIDCINECKKVGIENLNDYSRCCSCGPPLADCCENCSCATNSTYARIPVMVPRLGIFQVSITEAPFVTSPAQNVVQQLINALIAQSETPL